MKHFENIWEESEEIAIEYAEQNSDYDPISDVSTSISNITNEGLSLEEREALMGKILIALCYVSGKYEGLNTWRSLRLASNDMKIEVLDPDLESEL